ncbi:hypothetical protein [Microbispora sp. KK1-11]|uniref:hypothetical protein n=1 Tax=Microbispora sp. KK1-11 TaxID=2053005 RepID=UPI001157CA6D|nr:hypothetical protein [Microbispora sp. KK1-11]TQS28450.1 hypothetical protein FLW16_14200 [Microbispora sp. KK1-11]
MALAEHEAVVRLFCERPDLAADLLTRSLRVQLPDYDYAGLESADLTEVIPTERRADSVIAFRRKSPDDEPEPVLAVIVEVQRDRDSDKLWSWPLYLSSLRSRLKCPVMLLVVAPDAAIARWCARPIGLGHPGMVLTPLVVGPAEVPVITDPGQVTEDLELAVLSVIHHADTPQGPEILEALLTALHNLDRDQAGMYADMVRAALPGEIWDHLEMHLKTETYEYLSDWARDNIAKGKAEGKAEGQAEAILTVLSARGIEVSEDISEKIRKCNDLDRLAAWLRAAATVDSSDALLDDDIS